MDYTYKLIVKGLIVFQSKDLAAIKQRAKQYQDYRIVRSMF
jgi:hypothetical protein